MRRDDTSPKKEREIRHVATLIFFSSRRRHTSWPRDWSSGVCSSDLSRKILPAPTLRSANWHRKYGEDEVLIKVVSAGCNPKDWKHPMPDYFNIKLNQGDDCSGTVEADRKSVV